MEKYKNFYSKNIKIRTDVKTQMSPARMVQNLNGRRKRTWGIRF